MHTFSQQLAKHLRAVYFGGNWTSVNLQDTLADVTWQEATRQIDDTNTIATLVYHMHYYVREVTKVLEGGALEAKDKYSFATPNFSSADEWQAFCDSLWPEARTFAERIEQLPEDTLQHDFTDPKYGNYFSNLLGIIEHLHYHLGQIVILKKVLRKQNT